MTNENIVETHLGFMDVTTGLDPATGYPVGLTPVEDMLDPDDIPYELRPTAEPGRQVLWTEPGSTTPMPGTVIASVGPGVAHLSVLTLDGPRIVRDARFGVRPGISDSWSWPQ